MSEDQYHRGDVNAYLKAVSAHLPETVETNADLQVEFPDWNMAKVGSKTGIHQRHVAAEDETASDLAFAAARKLFEDPALDPGDVDYVIFCTQTPDHVLPTSACLLQNRLGLSKRCGALDVNLGCSGYVYGLSLAKGLIVSGQCRNVLLLTADTYTKMIAPDDGKVRVLFGDGAAASWISASPATGGRPAYRIGPAVFGTDGSGEAHLIARGGGFRAGATGCAAPRLSMNGPEVFAFTIREVPGCFEELLAAGGLDTADVDLVVPHQANAYMLTHLRERIGLDESRFVVELGSVGNTVSASIPIALDARGLLKTSCPPATVALLGFGVGYSWGGILLACQR